MVDVVDEESYCKADANQLLRSWLQRAKVSISSRETQGTSLLISSREPRYIFGEFFLNRPGPLSPYNINMLFIYPASHLPFPSCVFSPRSHFHMSHIHPFSHSPIPMQCIAM